MQIHAKATSDITKERYELIKHCVVSGTYSLYKNEVIANEISNSILLSLVNDVVAFDENEAWVHGQITKQSEIYFTDLWLYCYRYALHLTNNPEVAEDVSQTAIAALLQFKRPIMFIKGWLRSTVYNITMKYIKSKVRDTDIKNEVTMCLKTNNHEPIIDENILYQKLPTEYTKKLLSKADYILFNKIKSYSNLRLYALSVGISYQTAREHKHKIIHNLKVAYLKEHGWQGTPEILNFRQLANIKRFLKTLVNHAMNRDFNRLYHYCPNSIRSEITNSLSNVQELTDWGIQSLSCDKYQVYLFDAFNPISPSMYTINITINKANYIQITDCAIAPMLGIIAETEIGDLPTEKGMCTISMEHIRSLLV